LFRSDSFKAAVFHKSAGFLQFGFTGGGILFAALSKPDDASLKAVVISVYPLSPSLI
jgi:hypothetical protein